MAFMEVDTDATVPPFPPSVCHRVWPTPPLHHPLGPPFSGYMSSTSQLCIPHFPGCAHPTTLFSWKVHPHVPSLACGHPPFHPPPRFAPPAPCWCTPVSLFTQKGHSHPPPFPTPPPPVRPSLPSPPTSSLTSPLFLQPDAPIDTHTPFSVPTVDQRVKFSCSCFISQFTLFLLLSKLVSDILMLSNLNDDFEKDNIFKLLTKKSTF